jgi:hypothetical protein
MTADPPDPDGLDRVLSRLPETAPAPDELHCDDGELLALRRGTLAPEAAAGVDAHLARCGECRAVLRALAQPVPEAMLTRAEGAVARRRRWPYAVVGGLLAAAAAAAIVMLQPGVGDRPIPPEYGLTVSGGLRESRGDAPASLRFLPDSRVRVDLAPVAEMRGEAPSAAVFVSGPDGTLTAVPATVQRGAGGAIRVEGVARDLFGEPPGPRTLHVALASDPAALQGLAGRTAAQAHEAPGVRWLEAKVEYLRDVPGGEAPR